LKNKLGKFSRPYLSVQFALVSVNYQQQLVHLITPSLVAYIAWSNGLNRAVPFPSVCCAVPLQIMPLYSWYVRLPIFWDSQSLELLEMTEVVTPTLFCMVMQIMNSIILTMTFKSFSQCCSKALALFPEFRTVN